MADTESTTLAGIAPPAFRLPADTRIGAVRLQVSDLAQSIAFFTDLDGTITLDEQNPSRSAVAVTIQASSIDTNEPNRDTHLRSADFFSTGEFPTLSFKSIAVAPKGGDAFEVTGDLTIHGVTKRIDVPVSFLGAAKDPWGNEKIGFETEFTVNRKEFGLNWNAALETGGFLVGDEVKVGLSIQAAGAK